MNFQRNMINETQFSNVNSTQRFGQVLVQLHIYI